MLSCSLATAQSFEPFQILNNPITKDARFGYSVMSMGDLDGNGVPDILVGAPGENLVEIERTGTRSITMGGLWLIMMEDESLVGTIKRYKFLGQNLQPDSLGLNIMVRDASESSVPNSVYVMGKTGQSANFGTPVRILVREAYKIGLDGGSFTDTWNLVAQITSVVFVGDVNADGISDYVSISEDRPSSQTITFNDLAGEMTLNLPDATGFITKHVLSLNSAFSTSPNFGIHARAIGDLDGDDVSEIAVSDDNAIRIISISAGFTIKWSHQIDAEFLGLPSTGSFGETFEAVDDSGSPAHLMVPVQAESGAPGSLHFLTLASDGSLQSHQEISRSQFPAGPEFDFDRHISVSVESVDPVTSEVVFLMGLPFADVGSENAGAVHKFKIGSDSSVSRITSFSNFSLQSQDLSAGFDDRATLIGDLDGNGFPDLFHNNVVHYLGANTAIIGESTMDLTEDQVANGIGDLNGDGVPDIIVTPRFETGSTSGDYEGWAQIRFMNRDGTFDRFTMLEDVFGNVMADQLGGRFRFGHSSVNLEDVDGDGVSDLAISAPRFVDSGGGQTGYVFIVFMQENGEPKGVARIAISDGDDNFTFGGMHLAAPGDVNGDDIPDLAVGFPTNGRSFGATEKGAVHVLLLSELGSVISKSIILPESGVDLDIPGSAAMGWIESIGDLDRDGVPDLIMGPGEKSSGVVRGIYVLFLNADGSLRASRILDQSHGPLQELFSAASAAGKSPQRLWDLDGDGFDEIIVDYTDFATRRRGPMVISLAAILGAEILPRSTTLSTPVAGEDLPVEAEVRSLGGGEISKVEVNFRIAGQEKFLALEMNNEFGAMWSATIPGFLLTEQGMEYYFSASVVGRADHREPQNGVISVSVSTTSGPDQVIQAGVAEDGYRLISVPLALDQTDAGTILEVALGNYDESSWRFFRARSNLAELSQTQISIEPGSAYWLISRRQQFINWGAGSSVRTDSVFAISLPPSWSAFGLPFNFEIDQSLLATKSGSTPDIRRYSGAWEAHDTTLVPFEGYVIFNQTGSVDTLYIAPSTDIAEYSELFGTVGSKQGGVAEWAIPIHARMGRARDIDNLAVVGSTLLNRADPPPIGNFVRLAFEGADYPLSTAAKKLDNGLALWTFNISSERAGTVSVQFPDLSSVPPEYAVTLVDPATGIRQDMRAESRYAIASSGAGFERTLRLEVDASGSTIEELPTELRLFPNFPNPFSASTTLKYALPEPTYVELTIYDILGRRIATIEHAEKDAGHHVFVWDGRADQGMLVGPGLYFARLTTSQSSQSIAITRSK